METLHGANYAVEFTAAAILKCEIADAFLSSVVLLMGFDGVNGSQGAPGFTDESPRRHGTAGVPGTSHIDTSQFKFGSSLRSDGNAWAALYGASTDWALSTSNSSQFTIECWVKFSEIRAFLNAIVANSFLDVQWYFGVNAASQLTFGWIPGGGGGTVAISSTVTLTASTWYFLAVDKDASGKIRLYRDGVMVASATPADSTFEASDSAGLDIGSTGFTGAFTANGWIDELRITKGVARYASDSGFTVPTGAFPRE
jgi:hypothetical protein